MRKLLLLAALTLGVITAGTLNAPRAEAMALGTPAGIAAAAEGMNLAEETAYVCRRVWRCGPYGCGWRQRCWRTAPRFYGGHRYWRRHHRRW